MDVGIGFAVASVAETVSSIHLQCQREMYCYVIRYCKNGLEVHVLSSQGTERRGRGKGRQKATPDCFPNGSFVRESSVADWISSVESSELRKKIRTMHPLLETPSNNYCKYS